MSDAPRLVLLSSPGEPMPADVLAAARGLMDGARTRTVAYVSAASIHDDYLELNRVQWAALGEIEHLAVGSITIQEADELLRRAALLYIPGGNTFVLASRLRTAGLMPTLRAHLRRGLPYIGVSAGSVICGLDILNSNDVNAPGLGSFDGLGLLAFSLSVHYPAEPSVRSERDERIQQYLAFHARPVLSLGDGAEVRVGEEGVRLARGPGWLHKGGCDAVWLPSGLIREGA